MVRKLNSKSSTISWKLMCFAPIPHWQQFQLGLFISVVQKRLFFSVLSVSLPSASHFSVFLWKMKKGSSAENYSITSPLSPFPTVSSLDALCSLYFPIGDGLGFHVLLKCPMNSFSLFRALSWVLCKLPWSASWKTAWFGLNGSWRIFQNKARGEKTSLAFAQKWKPITVTVLHCRNSKPRRFPGVFTGFQKIKTFFLYPGKILWTLPSMALGLMGIHCNARHSV